MTLDKKQDFSPSTVFNLKRLIWVFLIVISATTQAQTPSTLYENNDQYGWAYGISSHSFSFTLNYTLPNTNVSQTEELLFDGFIKTGGVNGFKVTLNDSTILTIQEYLGQGELTPFSTSLTGRLLEGENIISIESTTSRPIENYNWGITNIRALATTTILSSPDLVVSEALITSEDLVENTPFQIEAEVSNIGEGIAEATNIQFYLSEDETIEETDTEIGTLSVVSLSANENEQITIDIELEQIDSSLYYGACVSVVSEEVDTDNNCSAGLQFSVPDTTPEIPPINISPMLLILLD